MEVILRRIAVNKGGRFLILSTDAFAGLPVLIQYVVHISTRSHLQPFGIHFIVSTASCRSHAATPLCLGYFTSQLARHGPTLSFGPVVRQYEDPFMAQAGSVKILSQFSFGGHY
jgi:hypothetical protein